MDDQFKHLDGDPEDFIGDELPDPWVKPGPWEDPTEKTSNDLRALTED